MFLDVFNELCLKRGEAPNTVAKKLDIASGTVSEWKKGRVPQNSTLKKLADYFGVSVEYMLGKEKNVVEQTVLDENTVMYRYNGKSYIKHFSKDQMEALHLVIDALTETK
jgi:transcriptional regulator with XRE-family HTH domain